MICRVDEARGSVEESPLISDRADERTPSLENRVARQWVSEPDTLGHRSGSLRDRTLLGWMQEELGRSGARSAALDVGCAFGNHLFMLNDRLGLDPAIRLVGVDLSEHGLPFARAFAAEVPGYENCEFHQADLTAGLPFAEGTFAVSNLADVLEHLERPVAALAELARVTERGGAVLVSTPVRDSAFKRASRVVDRLSRGRISRSYYAGKGASVGDHGHAVMHVDAGHDHISEMTVPELLTAGRQAGLTAEDVVPMTVMSGSAWFDRHPTLLAGLLLVEAAHERLARPSWGHGVCVRFRRI
jgi:SAM-dependent methyltransferase